MIAYHAGFISRIIIFTMCFLCSLSALEAKTLLIRLHGHLDRETMAGASARLSDAGLEKSDLVAIEISSSSGDLPEVLNFAKKLYELKLKQGFSVSAYIENSANGPAAMLPFLADWLGTSLFVSWGDILLDVERTLPANILRSTISSFVPENHPKAALLKLMAEAMADPAIEIVDDHGWRRKRSEEDAALPIINNAVETLVVNQHQLRLLGLVKNVGSLDEFYKNTGAEAASNEQTEEGGSEDLNGSDARLLEKLKKHIVFDTDGTNHIGRLYIGGKGTAITQSTWIYVKTALDHYKKTKPKFIILELDTPGGEVFAAQKISDALKEMDTLYNIPVVAVINNWAISAGAMLAYSCRFITIVRDAAMGAAEPVIQGEKGEMVSASEKVNSALRADFANRASFFDRDPILAEAMVDKAVIVVFRHGKIVKLDDESQIRKNAQEPDEIISSKDKLLTLNAQQLMRYQVADIKLEPASLEVISDKEIKEGSWPGKKMLLFQALFFDKIPGAMVSTYAMDWKTSFLAFISHPAAQSILFLALMLGVYMEISSPGLGLPAMVALGSLSLIILSSFALEAASMLELIMVFAGLALLALEAFILPGFGFPGVLGFVLVLGGIFSLMLPDLKLINYDANHEVWNAAGQEFFHRLAWLLGAFTLGIILIILLWRYVMPRTIFFKRLVSEGTEEASLGYISGLPPRALPPVGSPAIVFATLRPAGKILCQGEIYDAVSDGRYIEKDFSVRVIDTSSGRIIVAPDTSDDGG